MQPHRSFEFRHPGALLLDRLCRSPVLFAINAHLDSVRADEAQFNADGVAIDSRAAAKTLSDEIVRSHNQSHLWRLPKENACSFNRYLPGHAY